MANFDPYANLPDDFYYSPGVSPGQGTPDSGGWDPYASAPSDFYYSPGYSQGAAASKPAYSYSASPTYSKPSTPLSNNFTWSARSPTPVDENRYPYSGYDAYDTAAGNSIRDTYKPDYGTLTRKGTVPGRSAPNAFAPQAPPAAALSPFLTTRWDVGSGRGPSSQLGAFGTPLSGGTEVPGHSAASGWPHPASPGVAGWSPAVTASLGNSPPSNVSQLTPQHQPSHPIPSWLTPGYNASTAPQQPTDNAGGMGGPPASSGGAPASGGSPPAASSAPHSPGFPWWSHRPKPQHPAAPGGWPHWPPAGHRPHAPPRSHKPWWRH